jgi:hypothetical protein
LNLLIVVLAIAAGAWFVSAHAGSTPSPTPNGGVARAAMTHYQSDLVTVHRSAAKRIRTGELGSAKDLQTFLHYGDSQARKRSFNGVEAYLAQSIGNNWSPADAARVCDTLGTDFGSTKWDWSKSWW